MKTFIASTKVPRLVTATMIGALATGCGAVCIAGDGGYYVRHALVKFGDLDLGRHEGAAVLYRRIYAAAYDVCASFDTDIRDLPGWNKRNTCVHEAVRNAIATVNQPALSAIYNRHNPDPLPVTVATVPNR